MLMLQNSAKRVFALEAAARAHTPHDVRLPHPESQRERPRRGIEKEPRGHRDASGPGEIGALRVEPQHLHKPHAAHCTRTALLSAHQVAVRPERTSKAGRSNDIYDSPNHG